MLAAKLEQFTPGDFGGLSAAGASIAAILLLMYELVAEEQGVDPAVISGTRFFCVRMTGQRCVSLPLPSSMKLSGTPKKPAIP